jgi:hypothetical protein
VAFARARDTVAAETGAKTQRGKDIISQNATKHGILARNFRFKDDQEKAAYNTLVSELDGSVDRDDPLQRLLTEEVAIAHLRRGRALKLEQRTCPTAEPSHRACSQDHSEFEARGHWHLLRRSRVWQS